MTLPGPVMRRGGGGSEREQSTPRTAPTNTGVLYVVRATEKGPVEVPTRSSLTASSASSRRRQLLGRARLCLDVVRRGRHADVRPPRRRPGTRASATLKDTADVDALTVSGRLGPHAVPVTIDVVSVSGEGYQLIVAGTRRTLTTSPTLPDNATAELWAARTGVITVTSLSTRAPRATASTPYEDGRRDRRPGRDRRPQGPLRWQRCRDLGIGQVAMPGSTTPAAHEGIFAHCKENRRRGLLDAAADSLDPEGRRRRDPRAPGQPRARYGAPFNPAALVSGTLPGTIRRVPYNADRRGAPRPQRRRDTDHANIATACWRQRRASVASASPHRRSLRERRARRS